MATEGEDATMAESTSLEEIPWHESTGSQVPDAVAHLKGALAIVDRLMLDARTQPSEQATYHYLGEASRATHHALIALSECR